MHKLPIDQNKCRVWMRNCRVGGTPRKLPAAMYICSCHFFGSQGPSNQNPNPIAYMSPAPSKTAPAVIQSPADVPHSQESNCDDPGTPSTSVLVAECNAHPDIDEMLKSLEKYNVKPPVIVVSGGDGFEDMDTEDEGDEVETSVAQTHCFSNLGQIMKMAMTADSFISVKSTNSQKSVLARSLGSFEVEKDDEICYFQVNRKRKLEPSKTVETSEVQTREFGVQCEMPFLSYGKMKTWPDEDSKYFTGISKDSFEILYNFLGGDEVCRSLKYRVDRNTPVKELHAKHSPKGRLLLTLVRLRRGFSLRDMSMLFSLSTTVISFIFTSWVKLMSLRFKSLEKSLFVSAESQAKNKPKCFKPFPNLRCIVDCTEVKIQKPFNMEQQSNTFSKYKHHNTVKFIVAASVYGGLSYVSEGVEGAMSDRKVFLKCGILDLINPGEAVMVDRGFDIEADLNKRDIDIIIPPFLGTRKAFTEREMYTGKAVATTRIYVETLIGRIKEFKFIRGIVPNTMIDIVSDIMRVCAVLCNFNDPFVDWGEESKEKDVNE